MNQLHHLLQQQIEHHFGDNESVPRELHQFIEEINATYEEADRDIEERKREDKKLKLLAQSVKSSTDCISITDLQGTILFVNKTFLEVYGFHEEEVVGHNVDVIRSDRMDPAVTHGILPATLAGGWNGLVLNRRKDGSDFEIELWTAPVRDDDGTPFAYVGIARDLAEKKSIQKALDTSELKYRALFENANDPIILFRADTEKILDVNKMACEVYGYSKDEFLSMSLKSMTKNVSRGEGIIEEIQRKRFHRGFETVHLHKDGHEILFEGSASLIESDGSRTIMAILRDITNRRATENRLKQSEERLWLISENISDFILVLDDAGNIQFATESFRLLGFDKNELLGFQFVSFIHPDDQSGYTREVRQVTENYSHSSFVFRFLQKGGDPISMEASVSLMVGDEASQVMIAMRDVTNRRETGRSQSLADSRSAG